MHIVGQLQNTKTLKVKSYQLAYRPKNNNNTTIISKGKSKHNVDMLGIWNTHRIPDDDIELILTTMFTNGIQTIDRNIVHKGQ